MSTTAALDKYLRQIHDARFKEFEENVVRRQALFERAKKFEQSRDKRRREFLKGIGVDLAAFDREQEKERKTVKGSLDANAHGGGAYAELNFEAGTANYIEALLLSVQPV